SPLSLLPSTQTEEISQLPSDTGLEALELGPTLLRGSEEAVFPQLLRHRPVHPAVAVTGPELLIKAGLVKDRQESLGFLIAPVHSCHQERKFRDGSLNTTD
uniref:Uncharacterized protein n=1 Tax=Ornithorhynchus anatinus TaxID=9258 RepID=A0A6I8NT47_ORNAN